MALSLVRRLTRAAVAHERSPDDSTLSTLQDLARQAADHVRLGGTGTVDHIALCAVLKPIVGDHPEVGETLTSVGWQWV
jgi:hypothetical protein